MPDDRQRQGVAGAVQLLVGHARLAGAGEAGLLERGAGGGRAGGRHEAFGLQEVGDGGVGHGRRSVAAAHRHVKSAHASGTSQARLTSDQRR